MKKLILTSLVLAFTLSLNAQSWWGSSEKVRGNGKVIKETRNTKDYDQVSVGGSFDVYLVKGKEGKITIEGEENLLEHIETEVKGGNLKIKVEKGYDLRQTKKLIVTVPISDIEQVSLGGSGNITSETVIKAENFKVNLGGSGNVELKVDAEYIKSSIGGSGNIRLSGNTDQMSSSIAGSGSIRAYDLTANELTASIAGSGNVRVTVKDKIKATVAGSGSVYYKGNPPKIDTKSVGSGSVKKKG